MVALGEVEWGEVGKIAGEIGTELLNEVLFPQLLCQGVSGKESLSQFLTRIALRTTPQEYSQWLEDYGRKLLESEEVSKLPTRLLAPGPRH